MASEGKLAAAALAWAAKGGKPPPEIAALPKDQQKALSKGAGRLRGIITAKTKGK